MAKLDNSKMKKGGKMSKEYDDRKIEPINIEALIKASSENILSELAITCQEKSAKDREICQEIKKEQSK